MTTDARADAATPRIEALLRQPGTRVVVLGTADLPSAVVTMMILPDGGRAQPWWRTARRPLGWAGAAGKLGPGRLVMVPTTDAAAVTVGSEAGRLSAIGELLPGALRRTIPEVLGMAGAEGRAALVVSALPGTPMATMYDRWRHTTRPASVAADFEAAGEWLSQLQGAIAGRPIVLLVGDETMNRLAARFPADASLEPALRVLAAADARLRQVTVRTTVVHGNFCFDNLLVENGRVTGVVGWGGASTAGSPTDDLARFALTYAVDLDRHTRPGRPVAGHPGLCADSRGAGIRYALAADAWFPALVRRFVQSGLRRLGVPASLWRDVLFAGLADTAVSADEDAVAASHLAVLAGVPTRLYQ